MSLFGFEPAYMRSDHVGLELQTKGEEPIVHVLKTWQVRGESAVAITEQALYIAFAM